MEQILQELKNWKAANADKYGIVEMGVFGSVAREEANSDSDVDVVIELKEPDLLEMIGIKMELEQYLNRPVDIVSKNGSNTYLKKRIERDMVIV